MPLSLKFGFALLISTGFGAIAVAGPFAPYSSAYDYGAFAPAESEEESWSNLPALPAARIEDYNYSTTYVAWQRDLLEDDSPIEGFLAGLSPIFGAYALPGASTASAAFVADGDDTTFFASSYEEAWIEYLRLNQEFFGLLPSSSPLAEIAGVPDPAFDTAAPHSFIAASPGVDPLVDILTMNGVAPAAVDGIPEVSSSLAVLIGGALLGLRQLARRRLGR